MFRRDFLRLFAGALSGVLPAGLSARLSEAANATEQWNAGHIAHLLPTVSDSEILIKASFDRKLSLPPELSVGDMRIAGRMSDTQGWMWQFRASGLRPGKQYRLALKEAEQAGGAKLCDDWELATFPSPDARPERVRVLFYTCAGGHERFGFLPVALRRRLLRRALSFAPDAAIANGDHVYWDLRSPRHSRSFSQSSLGLSIGGKPDRSWPVLGTENERFLKNVAGPQIVPIYGTDFRSTPVFFIQDDHDYFENDEATDRIVTFPPDTFMSQLARATQRLYYPEFLPDGGRPDGLPGSQSNGEAQAVSESFGTMRYGRLLEALLYTTRRTMTLAGPSAVFLEDTVEKWLIDRMADSEASHVINVPSAPMGWTAGKWGEWYPDRLGAGGKMTVNPPKPYWQSGWLKQHDRLLAAMSAMKKRIALVISGDLHASAFGRIMATGETDLSANPVLSVLCGTIGTGEEGWPSHSRGVLSQPSMKLVMDEVVQPIEQHGFTIAEFTPDTIMLKMFKWDRKTQSPEDIDTLSPFHEVELRSAG